MDRIYTKSRVCIRYPGVKSTDGDTSFCVRDGVAPHGFGNPVAVLAPSTSQLGFWEEGVCMC